MDWIQGMSHAIDYMEEHLLEPIDIDAIASRQVRQPFTLCGCSICSPGLP